MFIAGKSISKGRSQLLRQFSTAGKQLPSSADVVVVGGGSIGASILYHLQKLDISCVLLEKHQATAGTTWHSAGMLWRLRPSDIDVELHTHTRNMCVQLEKETGVSSWTENGGLFIAKNAERMAEYQRLSETGRYYGIESHVLTPSQVKEVHPLINVEDIYGGMYSPTDGTIDPTGIVTAYLKAARALGASVFENTGVTKISTSDNSVKSVTTSCGHEIQTPMVVNACGAWAPGLAALVGAKIPLLAMKHAMVVTETIPGMNPSLPNVRDHDLSIYLKTQGDAMAIGGYEQNPEFWNNVDGEFSFGLFDLDWETFGQNLNGHLQRCPAIETVGIKSTVCGPESFTPDHKPLVGPQPGINGFFNACGFNSMGMMLGGGIGREVAYWITEGSPRLDLFSFDCARFHPDSVVSDQWVKDRTHESYAKTYSIVFPHDEPLAGRVDDMPRKSALYQELASRGCFYQSRHGFERPGWFDLTSKEGLQAPKGYDYYGAYDKEGQWRLGEDKEYNVTPHDSNPYLDLVESDLTFGWPKTHDIVAEECRAARSGVAIFDQSYFGKFLLTGPGAKQAVQHLCGADMDKQDLGTVTYTPLCNQRGGVEADLTVTRLPDGSGYYFAAGGNTATKDFEWIKRVVRDHDVALSDISKDLTMISVQGPHSRALLESLITSDHDLSEKSQPFSTAREVSIAGIDLLCLRLTFVGELGYELHVASEDALNVYKAIREAGEGYEKTHGVPVRDAGYRAIDSLSAEKNFRHWHADLSNADTPLEAGIGFTVLSKLKREDEPAFVGREALVEQRKAGLRRKLVCLTLDGEQLPLNGMETIWRDGKCLGVVRSTAFGHTIGKTIVYGYVVSDEKITKKWLQSGQWQIGDKGELHGASLHLGACFDPKNKRVKGQYDSKLSDELS